MDKAGDLLKSFLSFYRLEGGEKYVSFFSDWKSIVGEDLACHARAVDIRRNAILVEVDHPGWMQILQMRQADILKTIRKKHPDIGVQVLHMKLVKEGTGSDWTKGEGFRAPPAEETAAKAVPSVLQDKERRDFAENPLDAIQDADLKEKLSRLGRKIRDSKRGGSRG